MKRIWMWVLVILLLTVKVQAEEVPRPVLDALPEAAEELIEDVEISGVDSFSQGVGRLISGAGEKVGKILRERLRGAAGILAVVLLCAATEGFAQGVTGKGAAFLSMAGALSVTMLTAGSLDSLLGLGVDTIGELSLFSKALLPTLAAATAASGGVTTAAFQQVTTVFLVELLISCIDGLLLPMVYLYIGTLAAAGCLPENRLGAIAEGLKKVIVWVLTTMLLAFTIYLSVAGILSGAADGAAVKVTKAAISGVVPVVGKIISDAAETVLIGAGLLKNTIGILGMLAILSACVVPFLQLGIQYLLYKLTAFLAGAVGAPGLCKLIDGLGGAFGLVLGMTGSCALLLLVSVLSSVAAVAV